MLHLGNEDKLGFSTCISITNMFTYRPFGMSSNINLQDVTPSFHTLNGVPIEKGIHPHKQATNMFQHLANYSRKSLSYVVRNVMVEIG
jgi:hypothetical protein